MVEQQKIENLVKNYSPYDIDSSILKNQNIETNEIIWNIVAYLKEQKLTVRQAQKILSECSDRLLDFN